MTYRGNTVETASRIKLLQHPGRRFFTLRRRKVMNERREIVREVHIKCMDSDLPMKWEIRKIEKK